MRIAVKIGGAQLERDDARAVLAGAVAAARADGHELLVVHGGGNQIRALSQRLGVADRYHDGLRITDAETARIATQVLTGEVNKALVVSLGGAGVPAVGLCGADGGLFSAARHAPAGVDLGYVGSVHRVDRRLVDVLHGAGFVPVIATMAPLDADRPGDRDQLYNVNADHAAGPLAAALGCDALLFLTDVPGVLGADRARLAALTPAGCARLITAGVLSGGMLPKVDAALTALAALPGGIVKIAPATGDDAVRRALDADIGTRFHPDPEVASR